MEFSEVRGVLRKTVKRPYEEELRAKALEAVAAGGLPGDTDPKGWFAFDYHVGIDGQVRVVFTRLQGFPRLGKRVAIDTYCYVARPDGWCFEWEDCTSRPELPRPI